MCLEREIDLVGDDDLWRGVERGRGEGDEGGDQGRVERCGRERTKRRVSNPQRKEVLLHKIDAPGK